MSICPSATPPIPAHRPARGLYDPALDKDSCGVGFIADLKGRKSHKIIDDGLTILLNLEHRGAVGADPRMGDGAGILVQIPHKFFVKEAAGIGFKLPKPGEYAVGYLFMPQDSNWRQIIRDVYAEVVAREGLSMLGWREVPTDNSTLGESVKPTEPKHMQVFIGRGKKKFSEDEFERRLYILRKSISNAIYRRRERRTCGLLPGIDLLPHGDLQGYVPGRSARHILSRSARSGFRERACAGAPALLDQHFPDLVVGASVPLHRAQRRDQHAARQRQLDGGATGIGFLATVRQGHQQALADLLRRPVRHCLLRQRARIPGAGRLLARPRHDDDDSRSLGGQSAHGRGEARLLRIQRRADGAVGRPGRDRLHQRPADRRHP